MTRIAAGLGNPGARYARTRHNVGFMVLDRVARDMGLAFETYGRLARVAELRRKGLRGLLVEPLTFMNRSGRAVGDFAFRKLASLEDLLVVGDDMNLPLGRLRFRARGSAGGHKGFASVIRTLGTEEFPRLRCGIGSPPRRDGSGAVPEGRGRERNREAGPPDGIDFVLSTFSPGEDGEVERLVARAAEAVRLWLETGDLDLCMNRYNPDPDRNEGKSGSEEGRGRR